MPVRIEISFALQSVTEITDFACSCLLFLFTLLPMVGVFRGLLSLEMQCIVVKYWEALVFSGDVIVAALNMGHFESICENKHL